MNHNNTRFINEDTLTFDIDTMLNGSETFFTQARTNMDCNIFFHASIVNGFAIVLPCQIAK